MEEEEQSEQRELQKEVEEKDEREVEKKQKRRIGWKRKRMTSKGLKTWKKRKKRGSLLLALVFFHLLLRECL